MSYEQAYQDLRSGAWAERNPRRCPCRGSGAMLSDFDTVHTCPVHLTLGMRVAMAHYPDEDGWPFGEIPPSLAAIIAFEEADYVRGLIEDYAQQAGTTVEAIRAAVGVSLPLDVLDAAEELAIHAFYEAADERAQAAGYTCRLEAAWAADAAFERECLDQGLNPDQEQRGPRTAERDSWYWK